MRTSAGASLDLTNDEAIGNLSGGGATGGSITLNGNTLTVNESGTTTYSGAMSGTGGLVKQGAGALTLAGINPFTGPLTINGGTVALSGGSVLVDTGVVALNSGTLQVSSAETIGRLNGASGTTLTLGAGLTFGDAVDTTVASTIGGASTLTKRGTGTVVLTGANTYAGATTINAGTLVAANSTALGTTAAGTTVANGAQLQIAGVNVGAEAVTLNGAGPTGRRFADRRRQRVAGRRDHARNVEHDRRSEPRKFSDVERRRQRRARIDAGRRRHSDVRRCGR